MGDPIQLPTIENLWEDVRMAQENRDDIPTTQVFETFFCQIWTFSDDLLGRKFGSSDFTNYPGSCFYGGSRNSCRREFGNFGDKGTRDPSTGRRIGRITRIFRGFQFQAYRNYRKQISQGLPIWFSQNFRNHGY